MAAIVAGRSPPRPPYSAGTGNPWMPNRAQRRHPSRQNSRRSSRPSRSRSPFKVSRAKATAASCQCCCSAPRAKSIAPASLPLPETQVEAPPHPHSTTRRCRGKPEHHRAPSLGGPLTSTGALPHDVVWFPGVGLASDLAVPHREETFRSKGSRCDAGAAPPLYVGKGAFPLANQSDDSNGHCPEEPGWEGRTLPAAHEPEDLAGTHVTSDAFEGEAVEEPADDTKRTPTRSRL